MVTERFCVNKTGFEMFDIFRAYGLAFAVTGIQSSKIDAWISDKDYMFCIDVVGGAVPNKPDPELFVDSDEWLNVFGRVKWRKDAKKKPPKVDCEEILNTEYQRILDLHRHMGYVPSIGDKVKDGRTLYQTFDVSASKGFREVKVGSTYHEGSQLSVDKYSWSVACIGRVFFGTKVVRGGRKKGYVMTLVPSPKKVLVHEQRQFHKDLDLKHLCGLSPNATLVHYAIKLSLLLTAKRPNIKYGSIAFNVLQRTGQQPKPAGGGKYNLDLLEKLSTSRKVLNDLDREFAMSFVKGIRQNVALALADFLLRPTLENFRLFQSLYIRGQINDDLPLWGKEQLKVIMDHVEVK